ncbi:MAG: PIN domain-containing protein [Candidatus Nanohaloarchaea archaeon]|nr:PIN domain-containing protein [Candidatus Nanohaloarchaea archaeon]
MIVDTSFLIDLLRGDEAAVTKAEELEKQNAGYALPSPAVYETWIGLTRDGGSVEEKEELLDILRSQPVRGLNKEEAQDAAELQQELIDSGDRINHIDALIAGIARRADSEILTADTDEFDRVEGLDIETY